MTSKKDIQPHKGGKKISPQTAELVSEQQEAYIKSELQHFPVEDKRQVARREHTNGSTSRKDS
jgi:hypothetical protein